MIIRRLKTSNKNPVKDFCSGDLDGVVVCSRLCSGKMSRWTLPHEQSCYMLFYFTWRYRALLRSFTVQGRNIGPETRALLAAILRVFCCHSLVSRVKIHLFTGQNTLARC